jgi:hypothetical protein
MWKGVRVYMGKGVWVEMCSLILRKRNIGRNLFKDKQCVEAFKVVFVRNDDMGGSGEVGQVGQVMVMLVRGE